MNIVLLTGGSGNRLWPLSTPENSKQFLKILKTDDGRTESMLQRVFAQIHRVDPSAVVTVATSADQAAEIHRQLGEAIKISIGIKRNSNKFLKNPSPSLLLVDFSLGGCCLL